MGYNANKTASTGTLVGMQTWADKLMLKYGVPNLVHAQGAMQKHIPKNSGKIVQWRRWTPLPVVTTPLVEGDIPDGQLLTEEEVLATVYQYGAYTTKTDLFDLTHMDADMRGIIKLMANQGSRSQDAVIREVMAGTTTIQYANSKTAIYSLATTDELNIDEIRKMVRTLKKNLAPRFMQNGGAYYLAIIGPDTEFDIQNDTKWLDPATYKDTMKIYNGEVGKMYGVRFLETEVGKVYENEELVDGQVYLTCAGAISTLTITVDEVITTAEASALAGRYLSPYDSALGASATNRISITSATAGAAGAATVTVSADASFTVADGDILWANEYGQTGNDVFGTFVFGDEAYATADIKGSGRMRTIVKTAGEIGGPLEQFGTVGWKIPGMASAILQALWIGMILSGASE